MREGWSRSGGGGAREKMKTVYQIKKERPKFIGGTIVPSRKIYERIDYEEVVPLTMAERFVKHEEDFKKGKPVIVGADINFFAELAGGYEEQMSCAVKKLCTFMVNEDNAAEVLIGINCYDGAQHGITEKKLCNVTSYSTSVVSPTSVGKSYTTSNPSTILTWKQVIGDENMSTVAQSASYVYKWLGENIKDGVCNILGRTVNFSEVNDAKMMYALTAHSLWNRQYHPFLLCSCQRGDGVVDPNHTCTMLSDEEQELLFEKSLRKFNEKKKQTQTTMRSGTVIMQIRT